MGIYHFVCCNQCRTKRILHKCAILCGDRTKDDVQELLTNGQYLEHAALLISFLSEHHGHAVVILDDMGDECEAYEDDWYDKDQDAKSEAWERERFAKQQEIKP